MKKDIKRMKWEKSKLRVIKDVEEKKLKHQKFEKK